ncbi:MAG: lipid-A-disaccharide synthase-related protein [Prochlorotrichaceae cyanobacterium]|jgi:uncharacterized protein (TIGR03492 family)
MRLLCLSNGHGEDSIAVKILQSLQQRLPQLHCGALPLVGLGQAYTEANIPLIGPVQPMPSGGFIYMDSRELVKDVRKGLLQLTWQQGQSIRRWIRDGQGGSSQRPLILAVGDILPLAFAWWSGKPYAFVGTAKSEYYLRDEVGRLPKPKAQEIWFKLFGDPKSVYFSWERWLMKRSQCHAVFPRDQITTDLLKTYKIPAWGAGNPMMDGLEPQSLLEENLSAWDNSLKVLLLPGSRHPEAQRNWERILQAVDSLQDCYPGRRLLLLAALTPGLDRESFLQGLVAQGWRNALPPTYPVTPCSDSFSRNSTILQISQTAFPEYLHLADIAIAMAGTASEQFAGLGKPVLSILGRGPQFTPAFAEAQTRLLGASLTLCRHPAEIGTEVKKLMSDPDRLQLIAQNGRQRMGEPGAAQRIANHLISFWLSSS